MSFLLTLGELLLTSGDVLGDAAPDPTTCVTDNPLQGTLLPAPRMLWDSLGCSGVFSPLFSPLLFVCCFYACFSPLFCQITCLFSRSGPNYLV